MYRLKIWPLTKTYNMIAVHTIQYAELIYLFLLHLFSLFQVTEYKIHIEVNAKDRLYIKSMICEHLGTLYRIRTLDAPLL